MIDCTCIFIGSLIIALLAYKFFEMHVCCLHELFPFKKIPSAFVKALKCCIENKQFSNIGQEKNSVSTYNQQ